MRPRTAFGVLLLLGALLQVLSLSALPNTFRPLFGYVLWLSVSALVVLAIVLKARTLSQGAHAKQSSPGGPAIRQNIEGLSWFVFSAAVGLAIHLFSAFTADTTFRVRREMWLVFFVLAVSSWLQLRGKPGDSNAPIPDGSRLARFGDRLRRLVGLGLIGIGVWMLALGLREPGSATDGLTRAVVAFLLAGGAALCLIGLALTFLRGRDDA